MAAIKQYGQYLCSLSLSKISREDSTHVSKEVCGKYKVIYKYKTNIVSHLQNIYTVQNRKFFAHDSSRIVLDEPILYWQVLGYSGQYFVKDI